MRKVLLVIILLLPLVVGFVSHQAPPTNPDLQDQCGVIDSPDDISPPLDPEEFRLIQPFARVSGRFDGKLHAGEDWIGRRGRTLGEPVHAIAPGRVTYSDPLGWGRDKGVVIINHRFADGTSVYALYGHMEELNGIEFVDINSCVEKGDIVGAIGSPRPAPHLHFEIRTFSPGAPGPGYWDVDPRVRGWYDPREFITNWQAWLNEAYVWHRVLDDERGPVLPDLMRDDGVTLMLDRAVLKAYDGNGGRLWQLLIGSTFTPVAFDWVNEETIFIAGAEGRIQFWNPLGSYIDEWLTDIEELKMVIPFNDLFFLHDGQGTLHIYDRDRNRVREYGEIGDITSFAKSDAMLAITTSDEQLLLFGVDGSSLGREEVQLGSEVLAASGGGIYLRDRESLEYIDTDGDRNVLLDDLSVNRSDRAMLLASDGNIILWGINGRERLMSVAPDGDILWETDIDHVSPPLLRAHLIQANTCTLALADRRGRLFTINLDDGEVSGEIMVWGDHINGVWLGADRDDNLLRVHIGSQFATFDTQILSGRTCP
ncbi:MAG: M23 family metallopeptidase [Chloroflexi bacterium]|nr:M23 family metallopeptidase [Chloroflexota bacterium]